MFKFPGRIAVLLSVVALTAAGCFGGNDKGNNKSSSSPSTSAAAVEKPIVYVTMDVLQSMTERIGGGKLDVRAMVPSGNEVHEYEPKPSDLKDLSKAKLVIVNGLNLEHEWIDKAMTSYKGTPKEAAAGVSTVPILAGEYEGKPNPYAWTRPANGVVYANNIAKYLGEMDPGNKKTYEENAKKLVDELNGLEKSLKDTLAAVPEAKRALVTCEDLSYITKDSGFKEAYLWATGSEDEEHEGNPQQVGKVIEFVKENKVTDVFCQYGVKVKHMDPVLEATGAKLSGQFYVETLAQTEGGKPISYTEMLKKNTELIANTLGKQ